jgi:hypothetical protein
VPREAPASAAVKAAMVDALKPSADMMATVMANPALMKARKARTHARLC